LHEKVSLLAVLELGRSLLSVSWIFSQSNNEAEVVSALTTVNNVKAAVSDQAEISNPLIVGVL
jgi:hypothetical protein